MFSWRPRDRRRTGASTVAPTPTAHGAGAAPALDSGAERESLAQLKHTLEGRCAVLLRAVPAKERESDAPILLKRLGAIDDTVIRQPPLAAQRALRIARDNLSSSGQLAEIFEADPALAEALLRTANSTYYARGGEPRVSILEAVQTVGTRGVEMVITTKMVEGLLCRPGNAYAHLVTEIWAHMMRTAPIAREIAPAFGVAGETAFTVGLLHDAGKLIVFDFVSQLRNELRREIVVPERLLLDLLGRLHEPLGGVAVLRWKLGAEVARAIACHHWEPPPETPSPLGELVCLAESLEHAIRLGNRFDLERFSRESQMTFSTPAVRALVEKLPGVCLAHLRATDPGAAA